MVRKLGEEEAEVADINTALQVLSLRTLAVSSRKLDPGFQVSCDGNHEVGAGVRGQALQDRSSGRPSKKQMFPI